MVGGRRMATQDSSRARWWRAAPTMRWPCARAVAVAGAPGHERAGQTLDESARRRQDDRMAPDVPEPPSIAPLAVPSDFDDLVIGGGFFGCSLALYLRQTLGRRVVLLESGSELLLRASHSNQARVHNGYHYPRSLLTALRSRVNYPRFIEQFRDCVDQAFDKYYAVSRNFSKVTANQFRIFCTTIGAPITPAPAAIRKLFDPDLIEEVFTVQECAFDAVKLRHKMAALLAQHGVDVRFGTEAVRVRALADARLVVECGHAAGGYELAAKRVFNCTYSRINRLLAASSLPLIPLKHELTEIALVEVPDAIKNLGITVMCGPFFSVMPFPSRGLHSFSHVRYTPHCQWQDAPDRPYMDPYAVLASRPPKSNYPRMVLDARRYMPILAGCRQVDSLMEVKTVLPRSEMDDSRPILLRQDQGLRNLTCIMGAKIDNIFDMIEYVSGAATIVGRESA
jgi:glycine/D-amino acid oxidase-like deaminating enzyme